MAEQSNPTSEDTERRSAGAPSEANSSQGKSERKAELAQGKGERRGDSSQGKGERKGEARRGSGEHVSLKSVASLERLRDRVETAAHELKRLREENQALSERIKELESRPNVDPQGTFLSLDHDPELLRRKIGGFIEAIDRYLEKERSRS